MTGPTDRAKSDGLVFPRDVPFRQRTIGDLCYDVLSRNGLLFLLLILALVLARSVNGSHQKSLWYDEIFSVLVATQPTWHKFVQAMPSDGNPPLYALLARLSIHLFGLTDLTVRLPSMVAFLAALAGVYVFVRRECGVVLGLLAVVLTFSESGWTYSFEARPYALLLAFMMLALVSWQSAVRAAEAAPPRPRRLALVGMVIAIAGSILSHGIGIVEVGVPLLFGEGVRLYRTRRPDWPVLATALAAIPAMAITWPMMRRTHDLLLIYSQAGMFPLTLAKLRLYWITTPRLSLDLLVDYNLFLLLLILVILTRNLRGPSRSPVARPEPAPEGIAGRVPPHIIAAALGAALLIPMTMLTMMFSAGYYNCRYGIGCIAGIAILACLLLARRGRRQATTCLILILVFLIPYAHAYITEIRHPPARVDAIDPVLSSDRSGLPIAISDPFNFVQTWWYASPSMKNQIVYLTDTPTAIQHGYVVVEVALTAEKPLISARLEDCAGFLAVHDHFLIDTDGDVQFLFLKDRLESAGYRDTLLREDGFNHIYDIQRATSAGIINPIKAIR